jgi:antitoxin (DNA-binding transcriptional repressor) of toxin-antitoxin stability system
MIRINVHEAKTHLSRYLAKLAPGESLLVCKRNVPIAEIRRLPVPRAAKRPIGLAKGTFQVPPAFFEALPDEELEAWDGPGAVRPAPPPPTRGG